jgi:hypothetical protein
MKTKLLFALSFLMVTFCHAAVDHNYNGLSDIFELVYFYGSGNPFADTDGDGVSNYDEMFWGTNPTNAASKVTGPNTLLTGQNLQFTWFAAPYRNYELLASHDLVNWQSVATGSISNYSENVSAPNSPIHRYYRLTVSFQPGTAPDGLENWEEALYIETFGVPPSARDSDGDGVPDLQEFLSGLNPAKKDNPIVGLVVFTPLEK